MSILCLSCILIIKTFEIIESISVKLKSKLIMQNDKD